MRTKRPLGWWDEARPMRTHTRRCSNRREKIIALLTTLQDHPEYAKIRDFTHQVLSLSADKSASGFEEVSKRLDNELTSALNKLAKRVMTPDRARMLLTGEQVER
jgi:hypothetical protein